MANNETPQFFTAPDNAGSSCLLCSLCGLCGGFGGALLAELLSGVLIFDEA
jgi:hypothetical protein